MVLKTVGKQDKAEIGLGKKKNGLFVLDFLIHRKFLKMSEMVYNDYEKNERDKRANYLFAMTLFMKFFCFGLGDCTI